MFRAASQADPFATAVMLYERGEFTCKEWPARLDDEIAAARARATIDGAGATTRSPWGHER